jgi:N-acetylmuramoyl-L-alanine amidase
VLLAGAAADAGAAAGRLSAVRMQEAAGFTRVVLDLSAPAEHAMFTLPDPARVVIDLKGVQPRPGFTTQGSTAGQSRVRAVRSAVRGADFRIVLDLASAVRPGRVQVQQGPQGGRQLVLDLHSPAGQAAVAPQAPAPQAMVPQAPVPQAAVPQAAVPAPAAAPPARRPAPGRKVVISIDAGHGGQDPGAIGPGRIQEKHVTLNIARKLVARINRAPGFEAKLVRTGDHFIPLRQRADIAREQRADLFVSVHADAFRNPRVTGGSVYTLSDRGATSENARWLAERENRSDLIGGAGDVSLSEKDDMLAHVLLDLSMTANRSASIEAAQLVLGELARVGRLHKRRVEQAGFVVLKSPDIPSILVETGFISNPEEARKLNTAEHQDRLVDAIARGIIRYVENNAPPGSLIAARQNGGAVGNTAANTGNSAGSRGAGPSAGGFAGDVRYRIARGDTLSGIASRYGVSTNRLRAANGLRGDIIKVGQTLVIPAG